MEQFFITNWQEWVIVLLGFLSVYLIYLKALDEKKQKSISGELFALELVERGTTPILMCFVEPESCRIISAIDLAKLNRTSYAVNIDGTKFIKFYFINGSSPTFHKFKYSFDSKQKDTILQFSKLDDQTTVGTLIMNLKDSMNYKNDLDKFLH